LFRAPMPATDDREAGFTLIEVLVALAVVGFSLAAIGAVVSTNVRGVRALEQHVALIEAAQAAAVTAIPDRDQLVPGAIEGTTGGEHWRVQIAPLGAGWNAAAGKAGWVPELVTLRVRTASGATVDLRTVRLGRGPR
jgi:general secretion pathway protein I